MTHLLSLLIQLQKEFSEVTYCLSNIVYLVLVICWREKGRGRGRGRGEKEREREKEKGEGRREEGGER